MPARRVKKDKKAKEVDAPTAIYAHISGYEPVPILVDPELIVLLSGFHWRTSIQKDLIKQNADGSILETQGISLATVVMREGKRKVIPLSHFIMFGADTVKFPDVKRLESNQQAIKKNSIWWDYRRENLEIVDRGVKVSSTAEKHESVNTVLTIQRLSSEVMKLTQELNELKALKSA